MTKITVNLNLQDRTLRDYYQTDKTMRILLLMRLYPKTIVFQPVPLSELFKTSQGKFNFNKE